MKRSIKRTIAIILTLSMLWVVSGCKREISDNNNTNEKTETTLFDSFNSQIEQTSYNTDKLIQSDNKDYLESNFESAGSNEQLEGDLLLGYTLTDRDIDQLSNEIKLIGSWSDYDFKENELTEEKAIRLLCAGYGAVYDPFSDKTFISSESSNDVKGIFSGADANKIKAETVDNILYYLFGIEATHKVESEDFYYYDNGYYYFSKSAKQGGNVIWPEYINCETVSSDKFNVTYSYILTEGLTTAEKRVHALVSVYNFQNRKYVRIHSLDIENIGAANCTIKVNNVNGIIRRGRFINNIALVEKWGGGVAFVDLDGNILADINDGDSFDFSKRLNNDTVYLNDKLYDKSGNILISPDKQGFDGINYVTEDYLFAYKKESGFDGDLYYFGVLDTSGNWIQPLSSKLSIFAYDLIFPTDNIEYINDDLLLIMTPVTSSERHNHQRSDNLYILYDFKKDIIVSEFYAIEGLASPMGRIENSNTNTFLSQGTYTIFDGNKMYLYSQLFYEDMVICVDLESGSTEYIFGEYPTYRFSASNNYLADIGGNYTLSSGGIYDFIARKQILDLSELEIHEILLKKNRIIMVVAGKDSGYYLYMSDLKGNRIIEPIKISDENRWYNSNLDYFKAEDNCLVYKLKSENYFNVMDFDGNIKTIFIDKNLIDYDPDTGIYWCGTSGRSGTDIDVFGYDGELVLNISS